MGRYSGASTDVNGRAFIADPAVVLVLPMGIVGRAATATDELGATEAGPPPPPDTGGENMTAPVTVPMTANPVDWPLVFISPASTKSWGVPRREGLLERAWARPGSAESSDGSRRPLLPI